MRYYYRFREAEAEHQAYANAERDDRRGDRFDHRRGNSNGCAQNSAHAGGRTEQVANGGPRQTNETCSHPAGTEVSRGRQFARG